MIKMNDDTRDKNIYFLRLNNNQTKLWKVLYSYRFPILKRGFGYQNSRQRDHMLEPSFTEQKDHHNPYHIKNATDILDQIIPQRPFHCQIRQVSFLTQQY